jgi:hypothetical protein
MSRRSDSKYIDIDNLRFRLGSLVYSKERVSIYNMGSATECPTCAKGMCDVSLKKCYAARVENRFPKIKEARERQGTNWKLSSTEHFIHALKYLNTKHGIDLFRFNEASDFETQRDVDKMNEIASNVPQTVFGYTGNYMLDYSHSSFLVKMSHFNHICEGTTGRTVVIEKGEKPPLGFLVCPKTNKNSHIKKCDEGCGICWKIATKAIDVAFIRH